MFPAQDCAQETFWHPFAGYLFDRKHMGTKDFGPNGDPKLVFPEFPAHGWPLGNILGFWPGAQMFPAQENVS